MWRSMLKVAAATALVYFVHSLLASTWAKSQAVSLFGRRTADGLYRPAYLLVSVVLFALLVVYTRRQPVRELYRARGPLEWLMRAGQAAALACLAWTAYHVGLNHLTGRDSLAAWARKEADVPPMPDGQEPAPDGAGAMRASGPLAHSRHPLNWLMLPLFWLNPRMTTRLLAFNLATTAYVILGSHYAEVHMSETYGEAYRRYQERVPFFLPRP